MNAQKFTQKSLEAIQAAQNISISNHNMQIEEEHLACALLEQQDGLIPQLLRKMGIDENAVLRSCLLYTSYQREPINRGPYGKKSDSWRVFHCLSYRQSI